MKVFGGTYDGKYRYVVAAKSMTAAIKEFKRIFVATGVGSLRAYGGETGNSEEIEMANKEPGVIFRRNARDYTNKIWEREPFNIW